jgi:hypothetical protein
MVVWYHGIARYLILLGGLTALAWLPCGHTHLVFGSGLSRCSPVAMAGGSCQSPPPLLHAAVALHVLHVRAELLLAADRITPILGRRVGRQARRCLSILGTRISCIVRLRIHTGMWHGYLRGSERYLGTAVPTSRYRRMAQCAS